jgi:hypothetical protein
MWPHAFMIALLLYFPVARPLLRGAPASLVLVVDDACSSVVLQVIIPAVCRAGGGECAILLPTDFTLMLVQIYQCTFITDRVGCVSLSQVGCVRHLSKIRPLSQIQQLCKHHPRILADIKTSSLDGR